MTVSEIMVIPRSAKISFVVEECDACNGSGAASYRAIVNFQPPDQSLDLGPIQDQITQALAIETSEAGAPSPQPVLGSVYVNSQNPADKLQLNADSSFSLQEGGQAFSGTFAVSGDTLKLHIVQLGKDVDIAIDGKTLIVNGEETWTQP